MSKKFQMVHVYNYIPKKRRNKFYFAFKINGRSCLNTLRLYTVQVIWHLCRTSVLAIVSCLDIWWLQYCKCISY